MNTKKTLVVGGTSGIGLAYAKLAVAAHEDVTVMGHNVFDSESYKQVDEVLQCNAKILPLNICKKDSVQSCLQHVKKEGPYDILCYTAGIYQRASLTETTEQEWRDVFEINIHGFFLFAQCVLEKMVEVNRGSLITIASLAALRSAGNAAAYTASKGALVSLIRSIAKDYGPHGIRANAISPGLVATPLTEENIKRYGKSVSNNYPLRRIGSPEDVANLIAFITSDKADWITGQNYIIDGGMVC